MSQKTNGRQGQVGSKGGGEIWTQIDPEKESDFMAICFWKVVKSFLRLPSETLSLQICAST